MRVQGVISLKEDHVDHLFGKLATHSKCAGATLWLRDAFFADYRGRKVTISAPSRRIAACAIRTLLFQLSNKHGTDAALTSSSTWNYIDAKGETHGPYPFSKMLRWAEHNAFHDESLPVQHSSLGCWIPLWCLPLLDDLANNSHNNFGNFNEPEEVAMVDWETTVRQLNEDRSKGILHETIASSSTGAASRKKNGTVIITRTTALSDFPELQLCDDTLDNEIDGTSTSATAAAAAAPMDYELSHSIQFDVAPDSVRACVVVDTNILLSHMSFTERIFEKLASSGPRVEVLLIVPWIVLNELDRLKDAGGRERSDAARLALRRIRSLTSDRDSFVHAQSAAEHELVVAAGELSSKSQLNRELRNDDLILQTCLHWHRGLVATWRMAGHRAAVFLLSNDKGLCTRAEANGIQCFAAMEFPGTVEALADHVLAVEPVSMDETEASETAAAAAAAAEEVEAQLKIKEDELKTKVTKSSIVASAPVVAPPTATSTRTTSKQQPLPAPAPVVVPSSSPTQLPLQKHIPSTAISEQEQQEAALTESPLQRLESIIERCLAPGVKYYRQQDLGDLWIEMLEERSRPPWRAANVLDVLCSHSTTFWEYLGRKELDQARQLARFLSNKGHHHHHHGRGGGGPGEGKELSVDAITSLDSLHTLLSKLMQGLDKPRDDLNGTDPPNPAEVPDFISLGDARGALNEGVAETEEWLEQLGLL